MNGLPDETLLFKTMDTTWPAAETHSKGPWTLRLGLGGGKRVSAATSDQVVDETDIDAAEIAMEKMGQKAIFMLRGHNHSLDGLLVERGYRIVDPVLIYVASASALAQYSTDPHDAIPCVDPLALMREVWANGGITEPRLNVMARAPGPKTHLFSRHDQTPAGVGFVAIDNDIAMLHALEVTPGLRRQGIARKMMGGAAKWAVNQGAEFISVVVTSENTPACGLYTSLGMQVVGKYHYRMK
jgi:N-acetylglutamate synthase